MTDPNEDFAAWLEEQRIRQDIKHDDLAEAVGDKVTRRQTIRWLKEGKAPSGYSLVKLLSALGVRLAPAPPEELPLAVSAELAAIRRELRLLPGRIGDAGRLTLVAEELADALEQQATQLARLERLLSGAEQPPAGQAEP